MWVYSSKEETWANLERCLRLFKDGQNGWALLQPDGRAIHLTNEEYEKAMRGIDPEYWTKHPDAEKHPTFDIKKEFEGVKKEFEELKKVVLDKKEHKDGE